MNEPARLTAHVADEQGKQPHEEQRHHDEKEDRAKQQRLVDLELGEQTARNDLLPALKLPEDQPSNGHEPYVEIVPVKERHGRWPCRLDPLYEQTAPCAGCPEGHVQEKTQQRHSRADSEGERLSPDQEKLAPGSSAKRRHEPDQGNRRKRDQGSQDECQQAHHDALDRVESQKLGDSNPPRPH